MTLKTIDLELRAVAARAAAARPAARSCSSVTSAGADDRAGDLARAAGDRHQQIFDAEARTSNGAGLTKRFMCA